MANQQHFDILKQAVSIWNGWRKIHPEIEVDLSGIDLTGSDLRRADLSRAILEQTILAGSNLSNANLSESKLFQADLHQATLDKANLSDAYASRANLREAHLTDANLRGADLREVNLSKADLTGANLSAANLEGAILEGANLSRVTFHGSNLRKANLRDANLSQADFNKTMFDEADLTRANLTGVQMSKASFSGTNLTEAKLPPPLSPEELQLMAFYPLHSEINTLNTLLVYIYAQKAAEAVQTHAQDFKKFMKEIQGPTQSVFPQFLHPLMRDVDITIIPRCDHVTFNPPYVPMTWMEDWDYARFRFTASEELAGLAANGEVSIYVGPLLVGILKIPFFFHKKGSLTDRRETQSEAKGYFYKKIFPSYSHSDESVVIACRNAYKALGFDFLLDIDTLRSGQFFDEELMRNIEKSDIFQLFWSAHSAKSRYVRLEWKYALKQNKGEGFIRPVYWEKPYPKIPKDLDKLRQHFAYVPLPSMDKSHLYDSQFP